MTRATETELQALARKTAERPLSAGIARRLGSARARALAAAEPQPVVDRWAGAVTFATAAALALLFTAHAPTAIGPPDISSDPDAALFVYAEDELELLDDLEFYHWLESLEHSG